MTVRCLLVLGLFLISASCQERATDPLESSYRKLKEVPQDKWDILATKRILFGHQSVGRNIIDGLETVLRAVPELRLRIIDSGDPKDLQKPALAHVRIGQNRDPIGKIDHFRKILEGGPGQIVDVAFFKFCYVDVDQTTDLEPLIRHYDNTLAELRAQYPQATILPVTAPLTNTAPGVKAKLKKILGWGPALRADNVKRNRFNEHIRRTYGSSVWDLADIEATTADGAKVTLTGREERVFLLNRSYTMDGGHLNTVGSQVVAIDLLLRLASLDPD